MTKLFEKSLITLEYPKITARLADFARSEGAKQLARDLLPDTDEDEVREQLAQTNDALELTYKKGRPPIAAVSDVLPLVARAKLSSALSMGQLLQIARVLKVARELKSYYATDKMYAGSLESLFADLVSLSKLEREIFSSILSAEEMADDASAKLYDIRRTIRSKGAKIRDLMQKYIHSPAYQKYLQDPIITMRDGRYVLPVKSEHRSEIPGLVHDTSTSGATIFVEPMAVVEANNELRVLASAEQEEMERILAELSLMCAADEVLIRTDYQTVIRLDFIFAKADMAGEMEAICPRISDQGFSFIGTRHPLIDKDQVVPVDIRLGQEFDTLVITGPNTGGKTVSIKTAGLLIAMAQAGLFIPAKYESYTHVYDHVFADIGDEQSIEQSLSTFSSHMTTTVRIMDEAGDNSLVLFDELGAGTDPVEGAALAIAILETMRRRGAHTIATTHYAELKVFALETQGVENASCEFDVGTLAPTYRLLIGVPGRSNAFAISAKLGLDDQVIERARDLLSGESLRFEEIVSELEKNRIQSENLAKEAERMKAQAEKELEKLRIERDRLDQKAAKELDRARERARAIVMRTGEQANQMIADIEALKKKQDKADAKGLLSDARRRMRAGMKELDQVSDPVTRLPGANEPYTLPRALRIGDEVLVATLGKTGTLRSLPDSSGRALVQMGVISTRVQEKDLRLVERPQNTRKPQSQVSTKGVRKVLSLPQELDLRGMTVEEALMETDRFLDDATLAGAQQVTLIHGKGTGALRAAIQQHLKRHPQVAEFRAGRFGEGEMGVTIVTIK